MEKTFKTTINSIKNTLLLILLLVLIFQSVVIALEEDYPNKPITVIVTGGPGGGTDSGTRIIASVAFPKYLEQPFVIINKGEANGAVGINDLVNSKPDGYTLATTATSTVTLTPLLMNVGYTLDDITPICSMMEFTGFLCVRPDAPWETLEELIVYSKANPGSISYSNSGVWSFEDFALKTLNNVEGIDWIGVPFSGAAEAAMACISGAVNVYAGGGGGNPQITAGLLRPLAAFTDSRVSTFPDVPTLAELGYNIGASSTMGFVGPPGLPKNVVNKLEAALQSVYFDEDGAYQKIIVNRFGLGVSWMNSEQYYDRLHQLDNQFIEILSELQ